MKSLSPGAARSQRRPFPLLAVLGLAILPAPARGRGGADAVVAAMPAVVMIIAIDVDGGRLIPRQTGSGTIVDPDGSILTNYHLLVSAESSHLHDLFVVGRYRGPGRQPELACLGSPSRARLSPEDDLAVIRCDRDLLQRPFSPSGWPALDARHPESAELVPGQRLWVLGYPHVGDGTLRVTSGLVTGWTGERGGTARRDFIKTDAQISRGGSGGAALDESGSLVGVPTAYRSAIGTEGGNVAAVGTIGLVRPLERVAPLLPEVRAGAEARVRVTSTIVAEDTGRPLESATFTVLRGPAKTSELGTSALAWGRSDHLGRFVCNRPLPPGTYQIVVMAPGFVPLVLDAAFTVDGSSPPLYEPWPAIALRRDPLRRSSGDFGR